MNTDIIGNFIVECRKQNGFTQKQLAEQLNITNRAVSKWENGKSIPDASLMVPLCNILGITVNELLCGEKIERIDEYKNLADENLIIIQQQKQAAKNAARWSFGIILIVFLFWNWINIYNYGIQESVSRPEFFIMNFIVIIYFGIYILLTRKNNI